MRNQNGRDSDSKSLTGNRLLWVAVTAMSLCAAIWALWKNESQKPLRLVDLLLESRNEIGRPEHYPGHQDVDNARLILDVLLITLRVGDPSSHEPVLGRVEVQSGPDREIASEYSYRCEFFGGRRQRVIVVCESFGGHQPGSIGTRLGFVLELSLTSAETCPRRAFLFHIDRPESGCEIEFKEHTELSAMLRETITDPFVTDYHFRFTPAPPESSVTLEFVNSAFRQLPQYRTAAASVP